DAGIALLVTMLAMKLMEIRTLRDAMLLNVLGYFVVITNFFYTQTIPTALYMMGVVWLITAGMIAVQRERSFTHREILPVAGTLLAQAVPLMLVLFVLFPRVQGPLWGLPQDTRATITGLSDKMAPGSVSQLILSDAVAFRVKFEASPPQVQQLYWRGPVLWDFDGRTWNMGKPQPTLQAHYQSLDEPVRYTVTLEPHNQRWLFALDLPAQVPPASMVTRDFQLLANAPLRTRLRYDMSSHLRYRTDATENEAVLQRALQLPAGFNPRARELAQSWRSSSQSNNDVVQSALRYFREQSFFYTLNPPLLGNDGVDEFLFDTRRGFCEHYAGSFAFLMRAAGIPARVVTGYQGGELNPLGDFLTVRQTEAHAWAEVWLKETGWVRVDPTAAVSPLRVEAGIAAAVPVDEPVPFLVRTDAAWLKRVRFTWDNIANTWNQWVLGYGPERQRQLLRSAGMSATTWQNMVQALVMVVAVVVALLAALTLRRLRGRPRDAVLALYQKFCTRLAKRGLVRAAHEGPMDFCARVAYLRPDLAQQVQAISGLYVALRYGNVRDDGSRRMLAQLVRAFRV
ncbi:MAG: transglutaminase TgpA family protein, partial [Pseudomonadota bacterium]